MRAWVRVDNEFEKRRSRRAAWRVRMNCNAFCRWHGACRILLSALTMTAWIPLGQAQGTTAPAQQTWRFDRLDSIGGHATHIVGNPQLIDTPAGKAIQFNGVSDGIFVDDHPLAGAATYTWEVIFRPDADGP